jgi:C_GCAxxG_C_C family probable redox protein
VTPEKCAQAKARALSGYLDPGPDHLNCAQAVLVAGLLSTDQDPALVRAADYFGGGMVRMGQACGALTGAALALGLRDVGADGSLPKNSGFDPLQTIMRDFEAEFGAVTCKGLLGCDISTAEGFRQAKKTQALNRCPVFVEWVIDRMSGVVCQQAGATER